MKYNLDKLKQIPIGEVLDSIGADYAIQGNGKLMHCFNIEAHKNQDKKPSLTVYVKTNSCHCFACGLSGGLIEMAKMAFNGDFKKACEWLHTAWNIPFLDSGSYPSIKPNVPKRSLTLKEKVKHFEPQKEYRNIVLREIVSQYKDSSRDMQLKMVYTFIYRYSLTTEQSKKEAYYKNRGITCDVSIIGFLGWNDITRIEQELTKYFPIEDLQDFKVFSRKKYGWNYSKNVCVVPCFDLYADLICGFSLRAISGDSTIKELNSNYGVYGFYINLENSKRENNTTSTDADSTSYLAGLTYYNAFHRFSNKELYVSLNTMLGTTKSDVSMIDSDSYKDDFDFDSLNYGAELRAGVNIYNVLTNSYWTPELGLIYTGMVVDSYEIKHTKLTEYYDKTTINLLEGVAGLRFHHAYNQTTRFNAALGAKFRLYDDAKSQMKIAGETLANPLFATRDIKLPDTSYYVQFGLVKLLGDNVELSLNYQGNFAKDIQGHTAFARIGYWW